ncbi:hypothetical protein L0663_20010 [Dyadobacter sp. CY107]|uniref:hypothetical protein n=1 Tax=Dyadobacter fanqingshengii TaxID=2906443 RepID=UPI001F39006F|nr:hypothetical protein [Dyadobacter fanqingshengii]MCF2505690.1 hypothetical protein [Dyadobacter fanqingshengii]
MKQLFINGRLFSFFIYFILCLALSCTDHEVPEIPNSPESACTKLNGVTPREYPCEFKIEKLTFYAKDNSVIGEVTPGSPNIALPRSAAKTDSDPSANAVGDIGLITFDVKATVTRIANPSFPVSAGYQLRYTWHSSGPMALTTPGETTVMGSPIPLAIPVGASTELSFELSTMYELQNGMTGITPIIFRRLTAFFIYNDVTSAELDMHPSPAGDVAETYIRIFNTIDD